jgi:hypothetical protein
MELVPVVSQINPVHALPSYLWDISLNAVLLLYSSVYQVVFFSALCFPLKSLYGRLSHACYMNKYKEQIRMIMYKYYVFCTTYILTFLLRFRPNIVALE